MKIEKVFLWVIFALNLVGGYGCSASQNAMKASSQPLDSYETNRREEDKKPQDEARKVIYNATMNVTVKKLENQATDAVEIAKKHGGYLVNSDLDYATVRIPTALLDTFLNEVATFGKVKNRNLYSQDVTELYTDLEIRLENAQKARQRYLDLLQQATQVSDILQIERELERLNTEIEQLQGRKNSYDTQIAYSSVTVYFRQKVRPGPLGYVFVGLYEVVKFLFVWD